MDKRGGLSRFSIEIFLSHSAENFCRGILYCCKNFGYRKSLDKGGGNHDFPSEFLSHCIEIVHWRTLWCFRKILLSKIFMHRRGALRFCRNFCLTGPKRKALLRNPSVFRKISGIEKNLWIRGGVSRFPVEIFMSHSAQNFRKEILLFLRKFLVSKKYMDEKGGITFFRRKFSVSQCGKYSWASLRCFKKFYAY